MMDTAGDAIAIVESKLPRSMLHLASIIFLLGREQTVELATYDDRLLAANALGIFSALLHRQA